MVHFSLFRLGSTLLYQRSRHYFPILPGRKVAISFHFLRPSSATFFLKMQSSSGVQLPLIYLTVPSPVLLRSLSHLSMHSTLLFEGQFSLWDSSLTDNRCLSMNSFNSLWIRPMFSTLCISTNSMSLWSDSMFQFDVTSSKLGHYKQS